MPKVPTCTVTTIMDEAETLSALKIMQIDQSVEIPHSKATVVRAENSQGDSTTIAHCWDAASGQCTKQFHFHRALVQDVDWH
ncbi:unnamed protein product [Pieris brassicae]|uniref:Uncharacterized protein n=1 Tax=Pieris brassicae TaxID=7116 RepID=A0A9P0TYN0_PIEBR|nr:unnamed protein product [Pieris brassicae]